jgi:7-cyano-7-deazaguanine synthase
MKNKKYAVLSLSGGMDSSTLLLHLLANDYHVTCLSFDYGQKHKVELERATELVEYINSLLQIKSNHVYPTVKHQIIELDGLAQLLNSSLVEGGTDVPEGHYAEENMKDTVVPNRNKIFSSIIQAVALSITNEKNVECVIALGVHSGDHSIYPDCTEVFRNADEYAFKIGNWNSELVNYYTPYMEGNKFTILQDGLYCCKKLGLDFDEVYKRTNTSYKPIWIPYPESTSRVEEAHRIKFGEWYSDYKSASSVERIEAFIKLGITDPVSYADESGPVSWKVAKTHVETVLAEHSK